MEMNRALKKRNGCGRYCNSFERNINGRGLYGNGRGRNINGRRQYHNKRGHEKDVCLCKSRHKR
jgi:hypothetical protein